MLLNELINLNFRLLTAYLVPYIIARSARRYVERNIIIRLAPYKLVCLVRLPPPVQNER